jgi:hypothetical protein
VKFLIAECDKEFFVMEKNMERKPKPEIIL